MTVTSSGERRRHRITAAIPALTGFLPVLLYQLYTVNAFFPITEGWFSEFGRLIRQGQTPYTDFSLFLPPLYSLQIAALQALFGEAYLPLHIGGMAVTFAIYMTLYGLLRPLFHQWVAALAAMFGLFYYTRDTTYVDYDFIQFMTLYLTAAALCLIHYARKVFEPNPGNVWMPMAGAGLFMALAFLTKQSNSSVAIFFLDIIAACLAFRLRRPPQAARDLLILAAGSAVPLVLIGLWLALSGALGAFFSSIFTDAVASKGGLEVALFQWMGNFFDYDIYTRWLIYSLEWLGAGIIAVVTLSFAVGCVMDDANGQQVSLTSLSGYLWCRDGRDDVAAGVVGIAGVAALGLIVMGLYQAPMAFADIWGPLAHVVGCIGEEGIVTFYLVGALVAAILFLRKASAGKAHCFILFGFGVGLMCGNGTSSGVSQASTFIGLAVMMAGLLQMGTPRLLPAFVPLAFFLALGAGLVEAKYETPYKWWATDAAHDIRRGDCAETTGLLDGLCMPRTDYAEMMRLRDDILANSHEGDAVYVFPHMPVFNLLTNRAPYAGAVISWFDVMSDRQAFALAEKLRHDPPPVIVFAEIPESVYADHERMFRGGQPSAQRDIVKAIEDLRKNQTLRVADHIDALDGFPITVLVRSH